MLPAEVRTLTHVDVTSLMKALIRSRYTVVLTGAGISTESGIPDFRGTKGLWRDKDAMQLLSLETLYYEPHLFYSESLELLKTMRDKSPNAAHQTLAWLEGNSLVDMVITQNIDGLHHAAGSTNLLEIHGDLRVCKCFVCERRAPFELLTDAVEQGEIPPKCVCGNIMRPNVVFFGDPMPPCFDEAIAEAQKAELMLVVGSSLQVAPVAHLPSLAAQLAIINLEPTPYDEGAAIVLREKAGAVFSQLFSHIQKYITPS